MNINDSLNSIFRIKPDTQKGLLKLGISTVEDLLRHFPSYFVQASEASSISSALAGQPVTIYATIHKVDVRRTFRGHTPLTEAKVKDDSGKLTLMWLNQPYIAKQLTEGSTIRLEGKISENAAGKRIMMNPRFEIIRSSIVPTGGHGALFETEDTDVLSSPSYSTSKGVSSQWIEHHIQLCLAKGYHNIISDPIPSAVLNSLNLPSISSALVWMHKPRSQADYEVAKKRFAFDEIFLIQLMNFREREMIDDESSFAIKAPSVSQKEFLSRLPFSLTAGQKRVLSSIHSDLGKSRPMSRLLEGDVGSGKTIIAAITTHSVLSANPIGPDGYQIAIMAPTEILASQHFESFCSLFAHLPVDIGLITSSGCQKYPSKVWKTAPTEISRAQFLKSVKSGSISIIIGTHSLFQKTIEFNRLAYVIIDEQHRFGIKARHRLIQKGGSIPHLLSMTATPIPRTLALTLYGDLDLSVLDELPPGRKPVETTLVLPTKRDEMYVHLREILNQGQQVYIICPRIFEPDPSAARALIAKNVIDEAKRLSQKEFKGFSIQVLHGKLKPSEKEVVMKDFDDGKTQVLVATSVIEVGINVPNATAIVIEGAERFGLSQLHQLRGRVARSTVQAYCYLVSDSSNESSIKRLTTMTETSNGFELAERDLETRGPGELTGVRQSGISDIAMEALRNIKMVEVAREEAHKLIEEDQDLQKYPLLMKKITALSQKIHLE